MERRQALWGSLIFLLLVPGPVTLLVPWILCSWHMSPPLLGFAAFRVLGGLLMLAAAPALVDSFRRFALYGLGTPAPVAPPQRLVVTGLYRYVRNPMYVGAIALVLGQGLLFGSVNVLEYAFFLWLGFFAFVVLYEEPALRRKFAGDYEEFCEQVPRWIPRLKPYVPRRDAVP